MGCEEHLPACEEAVIFRPFYYYDLGCASYLLGCGTVGRCAVVDPRADDVEIYVAFARDKKMQIAQVIDTHVHADHRSGGVALAKATGASYRLHEASEVHVPFVPMRDGEELDLGNTRVRVVHTPGHSPESVSLVVTDLKRGTDPWFALTGDTLGDHIHRSKDWKTTPLFISLIKMPKLIAVGLIRTYRRKRNGNLPPEAVSKAPLMRGETTWSPMDKLWRIHGKANFQSRISSAMVSSGPLRFAHFRRTSTDSTT